MKNQDARLLLVTQFVIFTLQQAYENEIEKTIYLSKIEKDIYSFANFQFSSKDTDKFTEFLNSLDEPQWADGKHSGDCTKECHTCNRCFMNRINIQALMTLQTYENQTITNCEAYFSFLVFATIYFLCENSHADIITFAPKAKFLFDNNTNPKFKDISIKIGEQVNNFF